MKISPARNSAFSLLELIVVILIIGIVAAFVTPAASTIVRGSQLTQGTQILTDQIILARQLALTRNRPVEVRFIRYADPEVPGEVPTSGVGDPSMGSFRAIQCFEILESGGSVPIDKPQLFPQSVIMNSSSLSSLLSDPAMKTVKANASRDPKLPRNIEQNYDYVAFRFLPDGSTNLSPAPGKKWYVTLHNINDKGAGGVPPNNFFTLQIDPVSGATKNFRPQA